VRALDSVTRSARTDDVAVSSSSLKQSVTSSVVATAVDVGVGGSVCDGCSTHALSTPSPHFRSSRGDGDVASGRSPGTEAGVPLDCGCGRRTTTRQARRTQSTAEATTRPQRTCQRGHTPRRITHTTSQYTWTVESGPCSHAPCIAYVALECGIMVSAPEFRIIYGLLLISSSSSSSS